MRRLITSTMALITMTTLLYSIYLASSIYEEYNKSIKWKNSSLLSRIHEVPPSLAQDFISVEEQKLFQLLTDVNVALETIIENEEVPAGRSKEYWELYESAKEDFESSGVYESLPIRKIFEDFGLYLEADRAISNAYNELNVEKLDEYAKAFADRLAKEDNVVERTFLGELREISEDYKELNEFSKTAVSRLGVVEGDVLRVNIKVNKDVSDSVLKEIASKKLTKFSHIKDLVQVLEGDSWRNILNHNKSALEYYSWKDSEKILNSLLRANYVSVSSFNSVQDILSYNSSYPLQVKSNHIIEDDSEVLEVYYQGEILERGMYVKIGSPLTFDIDYNYTEKEMSTIIVRYLDIDGNRIIGIDDVTYTDYVGNSINVVAKDIDGYDFVRIDDNLNSFPESDTTIEVIYQEKPEPEPEPEPDDDIDDDESDNDIEDDVDDKDVENEDEDE